MMSLGALIILAGMVAGANRKGQKTYTVRLRVCKPKFSRQCIETWHKEML